MPLYSSVPTSIARPCRSSNTWHDHAQPPSHRLQAPRTYMVNKEVGSPLSNAHSLARVVHGLEGQLVLDAPLKHILLRMPLRSPDGIAEGRLSHLQFSAGLRYPHDRYGNTIPVCQLCFLPRHMVVFDELCNVPFPARPKHIMLCTH